MNYETTHTRAFHKCLNDLVKLRSERRKSEKRLRSAEPQELGITHPKRAPRREKRAASKGDVSLKLRELGSRATKNLIDRAHLSHENPNFEAQFEAEVNGLLENDRLEVAKAAA